MVRNDNALVERSRCAARTARTGRRCRRICRPGEQFCADHRPPGRTGTAFYAAALVGDEQARYEKALAIDGLDGEIALLRVLILKHIDDPSLVVKAVALLARAIATRYRFSKRHEESLYDSLLNTLKGFGEIVMPEGDAPHGAS